jgi:hypothetical protein
MLLMLVLAQACSRSSTVVVSGPATRHHVDEFGRNWIIELPNTATTKEVLSNYFGVLSLRDGQSVTHDRFELVDARGKVLAGTNLPLQRVVRYSIVDEELCWCPGGNFNQVTVDTDIGRKRVIIELASNHSSDPKATGWRCSISDAEPNANVQPKNAQP